MSVGRCTLKVKNLDYAVFTRIWRLSFFLCVLFFLVSNMQTYLRGDTMSDSRGLSHVSRLIDFVRLLALGGGRLNTIESVYARILIL